MDVSMYHYDAVDSTNTQCRRLAAEGVVNAVVTADCQTAGRGRMGRSFQSPPGLGLYLSVLWRTGLRTDTLPMVTPLAAVAVCRAIEEVCGLHCGIKWPNDLVLSGRKVCGILARPCRGRRAACGSSWASASTSASGGRISCRSCGRRRHRCP